MLQQKIERIQSLLNLSYLPKLISIFLLGLICWSVTQQVYFLSAHRQKKILSVYSADQSNKKNNQTTCFTAKDLQTVSNWHLFGQAMMSVTNNIPLSALSIKLTGILYSDSEKDSKASLSVNNQQEKIYSLNQTLPNGVQIEKILPHRVIIKYNGRLEKLLIYDKE